MSNAKKNCTDKLKFKIQHNTNSTMPKVSFKMKLTQKVNTVQYQGRYSQSSYVSDKNCIVCKLVPVDYTPIFYGCGGLLGIEIWFWMLKTGSQNVAWPCIAITSIHSDVSQQHKARINSLWNAPNCSHRELAVNKIVLSIPHLMQCYERSVASILWTCLYLNMALG